MQATKDVISWAIELYLKKIIKNTAIPAPTKRIKISNKNLFFIIYKISPGTNTNHNPTTVITKNTICA